MLDETAMAPLRDALNEQRESLIHELTEQGADPATDELGFADDAGFADRSHSTEERSRLIAVVKALRSNLHDVDRAISKMHAGTYGTCERCGTDLSRERLEALPWALLCIDCKQKGLPA